MRIKVIELIGNQGRFILDDDDRPSIGSRYDLEDFDNPTNRQNRTFHGLLTCYWTSGCHSSTAKDFHRFRDEVKVRLGAGFEKIVYADWIDGKAQIVECRRKDEIPRRILDDPDLAKIVKAKPLSWSEYSKKQRTDTIDRLKAEMVQAGVNTKKFHEILSGMEENSNKGERK